LPELLTRLQAIFQRVEVLLDGFLNDLNNLGGGKLTGKLKVDPEDFEPLLALSRFLPIERVVLHSLLDLVVLELD
jgi:hypothetical protein